VLSRVLRDRVGGHLEDVVAFGRAVLFDPIGLHDVVFEPDPSGVPVGSSYLYATARDWARLGELQLRDGTWLGRQILPAGWVEFMRTPAPAAPRGQYGGQLWLNRGAPDDPTRRLWPSLPTDACAMRGFSGQIVMMIPSLQLVVVRLGLSLPGADDGIATLMTDVVAATRP